MQLAHKRLARMATTMRLAAACWLLAQLCIGLALADQPTAAAVAAAGREIQDTKSAHSSALDRSATQIADSRASSPAWSSFKRLEPASQKDSTKLSGGGGNETRRSFKRRRKAMRNIADQELPAAAAPGGQKVMRQLDDKLESRDRTLASLLVHQLSDLMMNNQPEVIRQRLAGLEMADGLGANRAASSQGKTEGAGEHNRIALDEESGAAAGNSLEEAVAAAAAAVLDEDEDEEQQDEEEEEEQDEEAWRDEDDDEEAEERAEEENMLIRQARRRRPGRELRRRQASELETKKSWPWSWFGRGAQQDSVQIESEVGPVGVGGGQSDETAAAAAAAASCPSDFEDQILSMESNLNELVQSGANLSVDQRQQLLNGLDMSHLLQVNNLRDGQRRLVLQIQQQVQQLAPCYQVVGSGPIGGVPNGPGGLNNNMGLPISEQPTVLFITKVLTPILFFVIILIGLIGNITVICVILEDKKYERGDWTPANMLILDLSLADLSFILFCIPFTGWDYAVGHWVFGNTWCKANQYLIVVCALSSIYNLVLMSCDRYMAIVYPIECINYRTSRNVFRAIAIKWAAILLLALPTIPMHGLIPIASDDALDHNSLLLAASTPPPPLDSMHLQQQQQQQQAHQAQAQQLQQQSRQLEQLQPQEFTCRFQAEDYNPITFQVVFFITSFFLPLMLIFFLYLGLLRRLWCGRRPRGHKESTKALDQKKKITRMVAKIVIFFAVCWCPIQVMLILMRLKSFQITATYVAVQVSAHILGYMNSCVNPYIYVFSTDSFYQSWKRSRFGRFCLFWFCCNKSNDNQNSSSLNSHQHPLTSEHHTNGLNLKFGHPHRGGAGNPQTGGNTTLLVHGSTLSCSVSLDCNQQQARASRNSLQFVAPPATGFPAGKPQQRANKSLGNIFASQPLATVQQVPEPSADQEQAADSRTSSRQQTRVQLALEPRDRPAVSHTNPTRQQQQQQTPLLASSSACQLVQCHEQPLPAATSTKQTKTTTTTTPTTPTPTPTTTTTTAAFTRKATSSSELVARQPTSSAGVFRSLEHQRQARAKATEAPPASDSEGEDSSHDHNHHHHNQPLLCSANWDQSSTEHESNSDSLGPGKCCRCDRQNSDAASCHSMEFEGNDHRQAN